MAMDDKQRGVLTGVVAGAVIVAVALTLAIVLHPVALLPLGSGLDGRLGWAAMWSMLPALTLLLAIGALAGHRFRTPRDIDGSGLTDGSQDTRIAQAVIQNTLEQAVLATLVYGAYCATMPRGWLAAIPVAAVLFAIGRLLFALGYRRGAPGRALGFALTFYGTVALAAITLVAQVLRIFGI